MQSKPTFVHRDALKRMFRAFPEAGVEFANAMVAVQTMGSPVDAAYAGAAASASLSARAASAQSVASSGS
jgi:moderate conductance mechanosensitive channel